MAKKRNSGSKATHANKNNGVSKKPAEKVGTPNRITKRKRSPALDRFNFVGMLLLNGAIEIRILNTAEDKESSGRGVKSGYFTDLDAALSAIDQADECNPEAIYATLNPVSEQIVSRAYNRFAFPATNTTKDIEIDRRAFLMLDIDPKRPAGVSANAEEVEDAKDLADTVHSYLNQQGWPEPIRIFSGSGRYLLYRVDLPNNEESKNLVKQVLRSLAEQFDTPNAVIDRSVYNASRLVKIPGTMARKGDEVDGRKHRLTILSSVPNDGELSVVSLPQLKDVAFSSGGEVPASDLTNDHCFPQDDVGNEVVERCLKYLRKMNDAVAGEGGHNQTFWFAAVIARFGLSKQQAFEVISTINLEKCKPEWKENELWHKLHDAYKTVSEEGGIGKFKTSTVVSNDKKRLKDELPEIVADAFVHWLRDADGNLTMWSWRGQKIRWREGRYVVIKKDETILRDSLYRFLQDRFTGLTATLVNDVLRNAEALIALDSDATPPIFLGNSSANKHDDFHDPRIVYVGPTRLVNLVNRKTLPNTAAYFAFRRNSCDYHQAPGKPKRWLSFLNEIFGDEASCRLLQQWMGYLMTEDSSFQKILMLHGPTRSGKGTISKMIEALVGEENFCAPMFDSFSQQFGLSLLVNKTVAIVNDARRSSGKKNDSLTEKLLSLSGDDRLQIDKKYKDPVSARLTTRLMIFSNELPRIDDASGVIADRFLFLRTTKSFLDEEDRGLFGKLVKELPQILHWAIEGWEDLHQSEDFTVPDYFEQYRAQMRSLASPALGFISERCKIDPKSAVFKDELYAKYESWCASRGMAKYQETRANFDKALTSAYPQINGDSRGRLKGKRPYKWTGIGLISFSETIAGD